MNHAKIQLSTHEKELVNNAEWLLVKRDIIQKVYELFGQVQQQYKDIITQDQQQHLFPATGGKISRGENYRGLPYVILDYPALFEKGHTFAVRTLFWWGHFISISLHLSGRYLPAADRLLQSIPVLKENNFYVCLHHSEWEHTFDDGNFIPSADLEEVQWQQVINKDFFKISSQISLEHWDEVPAFLEKRFRSINRFVVNCRPGGETGL